MLKNLFIFFTMIVLLSACAAGSKFQYGAMSKVYNHYKIEDDSLELPPCYDANKIKEMSVAKPAKK